MTLLAAVRSFFTLIAGVVGTILCSLAALIVSAMRPGSPLLEQVIRTRRGRHYYNPLKSAV